MGDRHFDLHDLLLIDATGAPLRYINANVIKTFIAAFAFVKCNFIEFTQRCTDYKAISRVLAVRGVYISALARAVLFHPSRECSEPDSSLEPVSRLRTDFILRLLSQLIIKKSANDSHITCKIFFNIKKYINKVHIYVYTRHPDFNFMSIKLVGEYILILL